MRIPRLILSVLAAGVFWEAALSSQGLQALEPVDASGRVTYSIAEGTAGSAYRASDSELAMWALKAWEKTVGGALRFEPSSKEEDALVRIFWVPAGDSQYGEMRSVSVKGRRGAEVYIRPDTDGLGEMGVRARRDPLLRETIVYLTCVHELGHALGLDHTSDFRDIMYFFGFGGDISGYFNRYREQLKIRDDIARVSGLSQDDVRRVRTLYATR